MENYYREDLAYIHDKYFSSLAQNAALHLLNYLEETGFQGKRVVDLGCGSGNFASCLVRKGYELTGVDISPEMLKIAEANVPGATFVAASLFDYPIPECDVVTAIGEPFGYLFDGRSSYEELERLIGRIYRSLGKNGILLFDLLTNEVDNNPAPKIFAKEDVDMFVEVTVDTAVSVLTRKITSFRKTQDCYRKDVESHQQFLFDRKRVVELLESCNFQVAELSRYNGVDFRRGHFGFLCRKLAG